MHEHLAKRVLPVALRSRYNGFQFNLLLIIHRCARIIYFYALLDKAFCMLLSTAETTVYSPPFLQPC